MTLLIGLRGDRLGSRLCSMLNTMRVASVTGKDFKIAWQNSANFEFLDAKDIFSSEFMAKNFYDGWIDPISTPEDWRVSTVTAAEFEIQSAGLDQIFLTQGFGPLAFTDEDQSKASFDVAEAIKQVGWHAHVAPAIQKLLVGDFSEYKALHLRRGDLLQAPYNHVHFAGKYVSRAIYLQKMRDDSVSNPAQKFIVFSDDPQMIHWFRQRLGNVYAPGEIVDFSGMSSIQRDLVELILMSRCASVIAPTSSAYSQTAITIGLCHAEDISAIYPPDVQRRLIAEIVIAFLLSREDNQDLAHEAIAYALALEMQGEITAGLDVLEAAKRRVAPNAVLLGIMSRFHMHLRNYPLALLVAQDTISLIERTEQEHEILKGYPALPEAHYNFAEICLSFLGHAPRTAGDESAREVIRVAGITSIRLAIGRFGATERYQRMETLLLSEEPKHG